MPQTQSAKKTLRSSQRKELRNLAHKTHLKKVLIQTRKKITKESLQKAQKTLDRAVSKGIIRKQKAARLKSRLAKKQSS